MALLAIGMVACHAEESDPPEITCDRQPPLDWDNFGESYMTNHCTSCHSVDLSKSQRSGAPVDIEFDTYGDVLQNVELIERAAAGSDPLMPPSGTLGEQELELFREWLTCAVWPDHDALEANGQL